MQNSGESPRDAQNRMPAEVPREETSPSGDHPSAADESGSAGDQGELAQEPESTPAVEGADGARSTDSLSPPPTPPLWWQHPRTQLVVGVTGALIVAFLLSLGGWVCGAADSVRDVARQTFDYDAGQVDDLKERIRDRPYWQEKPTLLNRSLELVEADEYSPLARVDGLDATIVGVDGLVAEALAYDGDPIVVLGRVESRENLPGASIDFGTKEVTLTGPSGDAKLVLSLGGGVTSDIEGRTGSIVMARGVLAAYGRRKAADEPVGTPLGYFVVLEGLDIDRTDPRIRPYLRSLGVELPKLGNGSAGVGGGDLDGLLLP